MENKNLQPHAHIMEEYETHTCNISDIGVF
jgi:hypothetical protein